MDDYNGDDEYLLHLLSVAESHVITATNRSFEELTIDGELPLELQQAVLLIGGHFFANREAVSKINMNEVPYTIQALIKPFRKLA